MIIFNRSFSRTFVSAAFLCAALMALGACAARHSRSPSSGELLTLSESTPEGHGKHFWWAARFKIAWPPNHEPDGAVDLLLAHAVIEPVLRDYSDRLFRWRFHRRAARDKTGHQFSFLFYADVSTAADIFREVRKSDRLDDVLTARLVEEIILGDPDKPSRPQIEDVSDPRWSVALQKNWPSFIMGVSTLWLGLIDGEMGGLSTDHKMGISELLEAYRKAETNITTIWNREGQHALLHHLSAVFGYEPLLIRKEIQF